MKKLSVFLVILLCSAIAFGADKVYVEDLNADGVKEKVRYHQELGGNHMWGQLTITRQGKRVFQPAIYDIACEAYEIADISPLYHGKEIVYISFVDSRTVQNQNKATGYSFMAYRWSKDLKQFIAFQRLEATGLQLKTGDTKMVLAHIRKYQEPKINALEKIVARFIHAAAKQDWAKVGQMMEKNNGADLQNIKSYTKIYSTLPDRSCWVWDFSAHDPSFIVCTIQMQTGPEPVYQVIIHRGKINNFYPGMGD